MSHGSDSQSCIESVVALASLIGVSADRIRRWVKLGLLSATKADNGRWLFDFRQLQLAKLISELSNHGVPLTRIKRQLDNHRRRQELLGDEQIPAIGYSANLFIRDADGEPLELLGQRNFDFERGEEGSSLRYERADHLDELFDQALALEDSGQFTKAKAAYDEALAFAPDDPVLHFNLGNVLLELGDIDGAQAEYSDAIEWDPEYAEAWNNLGITLNLLEKYDEAAEALSRALLLCPGYMEAHENLAEAMSGLGRSREALHHQQIAERLGILGGE